MYEFKNWITYYYTSQIVTSLSLILALSLHQTLLRFGIITVVKNHKFSPRDGLCWRKNAHSQLTGSTAWCRLDVLSSISRCTKLKSWEKCNSSSTIDFFIRHQNVKEKMSLLYCLYLSQLTITKQLTSSIVASSIILFWFDFFFYIHFQKVIFIWCKKLLYFIYIIASIR